LFTYYLRQSSLNLVLDQIITIPRYTHASNFHKFISSCPTGVEEYILRWILLAMEGASNRSALHPQDIVPEEVQFVLDWNPPRLIPRSIPAQKTNLNWPTREPPDTAQSGMRTASTIGYSRPAAFYDMHLASHLTLERVVYLNTLVSDMASTVDQAIQDAATKGFLPKSKALLPSAQVIKYRVANYRWKPHHELGVAEAYAMHAAQNSLPIASTLAIHPSSQEWGSVLGWTRDPGAGRWAIADGVLIISTDTENVNGFQQFMQDEDAGMKAIIEQLASDDITLAVWEMKNLTVGTAQVMEEIVKRGQTHAKFPWKKCATAVCTRHRWKDDMPESRGDHDAGFDAISPPWTLPDVLSTSAADSRPTSLRKGLRSASAQSGATARLSYEELSSSPSEDGERVRGKKRRHDFDSLDDKRPPKKLKADLMDEKYGSYEPSFRARKEVNAESFLQQVTK
jgi:hypothetical protein